MRYTNAPSWGHQPTLEQWYANPFVQLLPTSNSLKIDNIAINSTILHPSLDETRGPQTDQNTLLFVLNGATQHRGKVENKKYTLNITTGHLMLLPRFHDVAACWETTVKVGLLHFSHARLINLLASDYQGDPEKVEFTPHYSLHDPFLRATSMELYRELENDNLLGTLFAETLVNALILHLTRKYSTIKNLPTTPDGRLTPLQLRLVDEYVQAHMDQKISLSDLAKTLNMSVPQFERAFRTTLHYPPYRYVLECKIERAKTLLMNTYLTLFDVALECGFANQSHLTRHFTKLVGVSPAQFRRGMRKI